MESIFVVSTISLPRESRKMLSASMLSSAVSIESRSSFLLLRFCDKGATELAITKTTTQSNRAMRVFVLNFSFFCYIKLLFRFKDIFHCSEPCKCFATELCEAFLSLLDGLLAGEV